MNIDEYIVLAGILGLNFDAWAVFVFCYREYFFKRLSQSFPDIPLNHAFNKGFGLA